jgi:hypothetical protein
MIMQVSLTILSRQNLNHHLGGLYFGYLILTKGNRNLSWPFSGRYLDRNAATSLEAFILQHMPITANT